ncbi:MAG: hypothetical protein EXS49_00330 [Candidatus Pacebacteria bacterium]|nr:hypothetical protein [Candidatus Paceibacterota bacterium]
MISQWINANDHWFNSLSIGVFLTMFVCYPILVWRKGYRQSAAYWLSPVDFSGPGECYASLSMKPELPKNQWMCLLAHLIGLFHAFIFGALVTNFVLTIPFLLFGWDGTLHN